MGIFELLFGARKEHNGGETSAKLDALSARLRRIEELNKDSSHHIMRELREIKGSGTLNREEIVRRIDTVHEKLQLAVEDFVVSDEDVKQIIRNSLKSGAKTFNEIQKDTKVSP